MYDGFEDLLNDVKNDDMNDGIVMDDGDTAIIDKIAILIEALILHPESYISTDILSNLEGTKPAMLQSSVKRKKEYTTSEPGANNYGNMHADYFESSSYVYTAILYDDHPDDLVGGETALVNFISDGKDATFGMRIMQNATKNLPNGNKDTAQINRELTSGLIVEPKRGRLVLFSSDGSNFHAPMEVLSGTRPTHHYWFVCKRGKVNG